MSSTNKSWFHGLSFAGLVVGLLMLACTSLTISAQTVVGRISGTVTDASGAVVSNASVTATNTATNLTRTATTDGSGFYTVTNLPVGTYVVTAEQVNFKKAVQEGISLTSDAKLTVDLALEAGAVTETVQITTSGGETVNTTSGEVARIIDTQQVQNLALNGRNYIQLLSLVPGVALLNDDQLELTTSLATGNQSINGNRGQTNNVTVDGGINLQSGSNASQINNVGIDYIQEVKIQTSNFSAEYGRNSGAQVSLVTRSVATSFTVAPSSSCETTNSMLVPFLLRSDQLCGSTTSATASAVLLLRTSFSSSAARSGNIFAGSRTLSGAQCRPWLNSTAISLLDCAALTA